MLFLNDHIRYERVISKNYEFYYEEIGTYMKSFLEEVRESGAHINGPVFYALNNVPENKIMNVEFFVPVKENIDTFGGMKFHSFFSVEKMLSMRVKNDFEHVTQVVYSALFSFIEDKNLKVLSPVYHVIDIVDEQPFVTIKIAYIEREK